MSSGIRKLKRSVLKHELGINDISDAYHQRYGYHTQKTKTEVKVENAIKKAKRKAARKIFKQRILSKLREEGKIK